MGRDRKAGWRVSAIGARNCAPNQQAWHWAGGYQSLIPLARTDLWAPKSLIPFESRCEFGVSGDR
jgi:hypothetical protein